MIADEGTPGAGEGFKKIGIVAALPVDVSNEVTSQDRTVLYATRQEPHYALSRDRAVPYVISLDLVAQA